MLKELIIRKLGGCTIADAIEFGNDVCTLQKEKDYANYDEDVNKKAQYLFAQWNRDQRDAEDYRN